MLSARAEKRLNRIVEIQEEMEKLEQELEAILCSPTLPAVEEKQPAPAGRKKKRRKGSRGESGSAAAETPRKAEKGPRQPCPECGSTRRHFKTCSRAAEVNSRGLPSASARLKDQEESTLSEEIKEEIREMRDRDMTTTEIARELSEKYEMDFESLKSEVAKVMTRAADRTVRQEVNKNPLSAEQYADVRSAMHGRDFSSAAYALSNKLRPSEVNHAIRSSSYDHYLELRSE